MRELLEWKNGENGEKGEGVASLLSDVGGGVRV